MIDVKQILANEQAIADLRAELTAVQGCVPAIADEMTAKRLADLAERVEALEKEANTHLYWTPSEIGAARHKARELMKHFDNIEKTDEPAPLGSDNSLEAYVEWRMESDALGSDNDLPPMRLKCGAHDKVEEEHENYWRQKRIAGGLRTENANLKAKNERLVKASEKHVGISLDLTTELKTAQATIERYKKTIQWQAKQINWYIDKE